MSSIFGKKEDAILIFGDKEEEINKAIQEISSIIQQDKVRFFFFDDDHAKFSINSDSHTTILNFGMEILSYCHYSAMSSILRTKKWLDGVNYGVMDSNFFVFSSSMRGLITSSGDTVYSLRNVPVWLEENFELLQKMLSKQEQVITMSEIKECYQSLSSLGDRITHFLFAKKDDDKKEQDPHKAKSDATYVRFLGEFQESVERKQEMRETYYKMYSELCEITHPASDTVLHYLAYPPEHREVSKLLLKQMDGNPLTKSEKALQQRAYKNGRDLIFSQIRPDKDTDRIKEFRQRYKSELPKILVESISVPLSIIKIIDNYFAPAFGTKEIPEYEFISNYPLWVQYKKFIEGKFGNSNA